MKSSASPVEAVLHSDTVHTLLQHSSDTLEQAAQQFTKAHARRFFGTWCHQWSTVVRLNSNVLQRVAQVLLVYLQQEHSKPAILQVVVDLTLQMQEMLTLHEEDDEDSMTPVTRQTILSICETWWIRNFPHKEQFIANALPYWLEQPEDAVAIKRLYQLREALDCIDFTQDSALLDKVLSLASNPFCLKTGKKLLVHLMQNMDLMEAMHHAIKVQMVGNKTKIVAVYAEVYFKAYHETKDISIQDAFEQIVWADLVQAVLHAADPNTHKAVRIMLQPLHAAQKQYEELLHRLYGPILWRALAASQTQVRLQAASILPEVFPLRGGEVQNASAAVEKCFTALVDLLRDDMPKVRVAGALATAQVLCDFWTILSSGQIRTLLNGIVTKHASDTSSASVRVGALNAIGLVLQNPQSHAVLRPLLPSLGNLLHDKTESVRLATVRMLLRVKETTDLAYYHVVPVFHLNARLASEAVNSSVAAAITSLIMSSYFPPDPSTQIARTLHFLQTDPKAAVVFYANVHRYLDTAQIAALAAMLWQTLLTAVQTEKSNAKSSSRHRNDDSSGKRRKKGNVSSDNSSDNEEEEEEFFSSADTSLMVTLTDTINILWRSIANDLNDDLVAFLVEHVDHWVDTLLHFESNPENRGVVQNILKLVRRLPACDDLKIDAVNPNVAGYLSVYCYWGRSEDVISTLAKSLESELGVEEEILFSTPEAKSKKRKGRRSKKDDNIELLPSTVALNVVHEFLQDPDVRPYLHSPLLEKALEKGTKLAEKMLRRDRMSTSAIVEADIAFVLRVCETYGRFVLHQAASTDDQNLALSPQTMNLLRWMSVKVLPALKDVDVPHQDSFDSTMPFNDPDLSTIAVEQSFADWPASPIPAGPPRRRRDTKTTPNRVEVQKRSSLGPEISRALARSLVQVACVVFSEWLAVSGGVGGSEIDAQVSDWFSLISDDPSLVAVMSRLAFQLARSSDQYMLMERILQKGLEANGVFQEVVAVLCGPLSKSQHKMIEIVLDSAKRLYCPLEEDSDNGYCSSRDELWANSSSAIALAWKTILSNRSSAAVLVNMVNKTPDDPFHKQCLHLLDGGKNVEGGSDSTLRSKEGVVA